MVLVPLRVFSVKRSGSFSGTPVEPKNHDRRHLIIDYFLI